MKKGLLVFGLIVAAFAVVGCQGGDVTEKGAMDSYKVQEEKAKALAEKNGEKVESSSTGQGE